jgi:hypothetical protein
MPVQLSRAQPGSAADGGVRWDNRLSFMDQAMFLVQRASGRNAVVQCVWVYEHAIDLAALRRFHRRLGDGLLGRRIERSLLPFARHRWVRDRGQADADIDIAERARPRAELSDWLGERAQLWVDAERGPGWHLGVLPLTDGSTAVSLVASHCLVDGLGVIGAVADAAGGNTRDLGYPPPRSRPRLRGLAQDARQTMGGAPDVWRAIVGATKMTRRRPRDETPSPPRRPLPVHAAEQDEPVVVPAVAIHVDLDEWDVRAGDLGGTSHHLAAGLAAKLAEGMGRRRIGDGAVTLQIPLSDRTEGDTRANTLSFVDVRIDPAPVTSDLSDARAAIREAFEALRRAPEQASPLLPLAPLAPFAPRRALRRLTEGAFSYADLPVAFSSMGDMPPLADSPDGTQAEYAFGGGVIQRVMRRDLERAHGELALFLLRTGGKMCITVTAYRPCERNSKSELRDLVARALAEFHLTGVIE